jgi:hypothetical protein
MKKIFYCEAESFRHAIPRVTLIAKPAAAKNYYDKYFPTIGILLPIPNALGDTLKIGGV